MSADREHATNSLIPWISCLERRHIMPTASQADLRRRLSVETEGPRLRRRLLFPDCIASFQHLLRRSDVSWQPVHARATPGSSEDPLPIEEESSPMNAERHVARFLFALVRANAWMLRRRHDARCGWHRSALAPSAGADEYRYMLVPSNAALAQHAVDCCGDVACQGNRTLFATFAAKQNLRASPSNNRSATSTPRASETLAPVRARNNSSVRSRRPSGESLLGASRRISSSA